MLISTEIHSFKKYGNNKQILSLLKQSGFEAYDFSMNFSTPDCFIFDDDYLEKAQELRKYADSIGIVCNQSHAPFPLIKPVNEEWAQEIYKTISTRLKRKFPVGSDDKKEYREVLKMLVFRALEVSGVLGAKYCVVHPFTEFTPEQNFEMYSDFIEIANKCNVKIAVENMWDWDNEKDQAFAVSCSHHDNFKAHMDLLPESTFGACLDIGHAEMRGLSTDSTKMILTLNDRLKCLHLHDNDMHYDEHLLPFTSKIDFNAVIEALAKINYQGDITFEAENYMRRFDLDFYPVAAKYMYSIGDYIRSQIKKKTNIK